MIEDASYIDAVHRWVKEIVVGLELCPFARQPLERETLGFRISRARTESDLYVDTVRALEAFLQADPAVESTTLFIFPNALADFECFNDFLSGLESNLEETDLGNLVQIVGFHPDYCFQDADPEDPANYTNRSPWPMIHFIRYEEMAAALAHTPNPAAIPEANIARLRALGRADLAGRLARIKTI